MKLLAVHLNFKYVSNVQEGQFSRIHTVGILKLFQLSGLDIGKSPKFFLSRPVVLNGLNFLQATSMTEKLSLEKWHRFNYGTGNCCRKISEKWPIVKNRRRQRQPLKHYLYN